MEWKEKYKLDLSSCYFRDQVVLLLCGRQSPYFVACQFTIVNETRDAQTAATYIKLEWQSGLLLLFTRWIEHYTTVASRMNHNRRKERESFVVVLLFVVSLYLSFVDAIITKQK